MREGRFANLSGAVLLGGASSRMGSDKAMLLRDGVPLATHAAELLAGLCVDVMLVGGDPPASAPGRAVEDPEGPQSALRGLCAALGAATTERVIALATDLPLVTPDLLLALSAWPEHAAVVPRNSDGTHALCGIYRVADVLPVARQHLADGVLSLRGLLDVVDTAFIEGDVLDALSDGGQALTNVNQPADWEALGRSHRLE